MEKISEKITAAACSQSECEGCEIEGKLLCVHKPKDLIDFYVLFIGWAIPFFAGMIIGKFWVGIMVRHWSLRAGHCSELNATAATICHVRLTECLKTSERLFSETIRNLVKHGVKQIRIAAEFNWESLCLTNLKK